MGMENRKFRRVVVGRDFTVSFVAGGASYAAVRLGNLSEGGCLALLPSAKATGLETGEVLEGFTLHHETMPAQEIEAQVAFALGAGDPDLEWAGVGVRFVAVPGGVLRSLRDFVAASPEPF